MNTGLATTWEERLGDLGNIPASRIRCEPAPGSATVDDVERYRKIDGRLYELIDGTLVEKPMGWQESLLAGVLLHWLHQFLDEHNLGVATGPDGMTRLFGDTVRGPDVAFVSWDRLPFGVLPKEAIPDLVPNLAIEILSTGNTYGEMSRKRREYFHAGVQSVWIIDPRNRTVSVFHTPQTATQYNESDVIIADGILAGWRVDTGALFGKLDSRHP